MHLILGPSRHGVTRHGAALAEGQSQLTLPGHDPATELREALASTADADVHLHLTDHLLGATPGEIEASLTALFDSGAPVHVTLHDIPQPEEGEARYARRAALYADIARRAQSVQVCSEHERSLVQRIASDVEPAVVPLPVDVAKVAHPEHSERSVGMLGFIHPGKEPELLVEIAAGHQADAVFLGAPAAGHEDMADALVAAAQERGVRGVVMGHLSEADMDEAISRVGVPFAAYRHISASGSIGRWVAAGRRPIVVRDAWTEEFERRAPGTLNLVAPEGLSDAVGAALADPDSTWIEGDADGVLSTQDARERQRALLLEAMRRRARD